MLDVELVLKLVAICLSVLSVVMVPLIKWVMSLSKRQGVFETTQENLVETLGKLNRDIDAVKDRCVTHQISTGKIQEKLDLLLREVDNSRKLMEQLQRTIYEVMLKSKQGE